MKAKVRKRINILIRLLIMMVTVWFLYDQIFQQRDFSPIIALIVDLFHSSRFYYFMASLLVLMIVNQALETYKWKLLIDKLEIVGFNRAFTAVLTGIAVSLFMPNRTGDYFGRVFILERSSHIKAILVTIIGSYAQLLTTMTAGLVGMIFFLPEYFHETLVQHPWMYAAMLVMVSITIGAATLFYFNLPVLNMLLAAIFRKNYAKMLDYAGVFALYSRVELLNVLLLSIARYLVFSFQFYLLLILFEVNIGYLPAMMLIAISYLILTLIPTLALTELGVRGSVSYYFFGLYFSMAGLWTEATGMAILAASTSLWLINLALPALLGTLFVYRLKFIRRNDVTG
jgi:hypothetical protein